MALRSPKIRYTKYEVRFRPPPITLSGEILIPILHSKQQQLRRLARRLNGAAFYVKAVKGAPERVEGGYIIMAKLKPVPPVSAD